MIILGIDPGLVKTGYGLIQVENNNYRILDFGIVTLIGNTFLISSINSLLK